jgi:hypothetical protein
MTSWRKELRELIRRMPDRGDEIDTTIKAMSEAESDRGCALIAGSVAEDGLETILRSHLVSLSKTKVDELFGIERPLSSFTAKIKIAYAFGFIDGSLRDHFDKIREIRNVFAHSKIAIDFNTPAIRRSCVGLLGSTDANKINPRDIYLNTAYILMIAGAISVSQQASSGLRRPISFDEVLAFWYKSTRQSLPQTQKSPPAESKETIPQDPPRSSPE